MEAPPGKHIFGTVKVGERGQIVIPKAARDVFGIKPGDTLLLLGDEAQGIAIVRNDLFMKFAQDVLGAQQGSAPDDQGAQDGGAQGAGAHSADAQDAGAQDSGAPSGPGDDR